MDPMSELSEVYSCTYAYVSGGTDGRGRGGAAAGQRGAARQPGGRDRTYALRPHPRPQMKTQPGALPSGSQIPFGNEGLLSGSGSQTERHA